MLTPDPKKFDPFIFIYHHKITSELSKINKYYDRIEIFFNEEKEKIEFEFENKAEKIKLLDKQQRHELIEDYGWELSSCQSDFPALLRASALITIYNLLEHHLNDLCLYFEAKNISKIKLNDISGKGIEKSKKYLTKVVEINFDSLNTEWSFIKSLNLVRNHIVHNGSILPADEGHKLNIFVSSCPELTGLSGKELIINNGFIHHVLEELMSFFNKLLKEIIE